MFAMPGRVLAVRLSSTALKPVLLMTSRNLAMVTFDRRT
jgi:hypothetical protein